MVQVTKNAGTELDQLAAQADRVGLDADQADAAANDPGGAQPAPPPMTNAQVLGFAFEMIRETLCTVAGVQSPRVTASNDKLQPLAEAWGAVCDKHQVDLSSMVGDYIIELKAITLTVPVILAARSALQAEIAAKHRKADDQDAARTVDQAAGPQGPHDGE